MSTDDAAFEYEKWLTEMLGTALEEEMDRRTRIIDRVHAALLVYAALVGSIVGTTKFSELHTMSRGAACVLAFMSVFVLIFWHQAVRVQRVTRWNPNALEDVTERYESSSARAHEIRVRTQASVQRLRLTNRALAETRRRMHESVLIALVAGAVVVAQRFFCS